MVFKYQTLKNLCDKVLKGKIGISSDSVRMLKEHLENEAEQLLIEAHELARMSGRKRINAVHIEKAKQILRDKRR